MRVYVGFDDTDHVEADRGTGKVARWFEDALPEDCRMEGVLRQQLLVHEGIPYTSHNSAACIVLEVPDASLLEPPPPAKKAASSRSRGRYYNKRPNTRTRRRSRPRSPNKKQEDRMSG